MMRLLPALIAFMAWTASASAYEKLIVAQCGAEGCRCALSTVTAEEAGVVLGVAPPSTGGTLTLVEYEGSYIWSPLSPEEIDLAVGGDGQCPLELFDAMAPEDGEWHGTIRQRSVLQCPAVLEPMLAGLSDQMVFSRRMSWGGAFHPDKIRMEGAAAAIRWTKIGDNYFSGEGPRAGETGPTSMVDVGVLYDARLTDPRAVAITVGVNITAKGVSQAVIDAAGLGNCRVRIDVDFARIGG